MPKVISNTSCLIALRDIERLDLLQKRYGSVLVTPEVAREYNGVLPEWITVTPVQDTYRTVLINNHLDLGEASTIALATETEDPLLILDDGKARNYVQALHIKMTGTLGIIRKCYELGIINDIAAIIRDLQSVNFRMSHDVEEMMLRDTKK